VLSKRILNTAIFLAKLDVRIRIGIIDNNLDNIESEKLAELEDLFRIVPWKKFKAKEQCILNPTFNKGSTLVGGADADLIIDNLLIDIKSSKHCKISRDDINQVIGYYLLSIIGGVTDCKKIGINELGIYFASYGLQKNRN
jgi:hypothetical protein